ncbi:MAG: hypothetical protein U9Q99_00385 [Nanoarchaeota archaeon]|nr:hypothetical protein [Nanoarchaeota archaeon]
MEKLIGPVIGVSSGIIVGTMDILTSGLPLFTSYFLAKGLSDMNNGKQFYSNNKKEILINFGSYLIGNVAPFYLKYSGEVNNFLEGVLK